MQGVKGLRVTAKVGPLLMDTRELWIYRTLVPRPPQAFNRSLKAAMKSLGTRLLIRGVEIESAFMKYSIAQSDLIEYTDLIPKVPQFMEHHCTAGLYK